MIGTDNLRSEGTGTRPKPAACGIIFDIKRYAIHDGPGIRATVFLKGCPLSCWWCHNPEGLNPGIEKMLHPPKSSKKNGTTVGMEKTDEEVMREIEKENLFFDQSGGGVTFSGGEPLMQPEFLMALLHRCREKGIHTTLDTSGYAEPEIFKSVARLVDLFLFDLKFMDDSLHRKYTGADNRLILENLKYLDEQAGKFIIRMPVVPTITDSLENIREIARFVLSLKRAERIDLLAYHAFAGAKYKKLRMKNKMNELLENAAKERSVSVDELTRQSLSRVRSYFRSRGLAVRQGG
jgi:pyruvate formate lyase activating enzyme